MARYLQSVDLEALDLSGIDLGEEAPASGQAQPASAARLAAGAAIAAATGFVGQSNWYALHGDSWWLVALSCLVAWVVGAPGARAAGALGQAVASRAARGRGLRLPGLRLTPRGQRLGLLGVGAGGIGLLLWLHPAAPAAGGFGMGWFGAAVLALGSGITLGRWLVAQGEHDRARSAGTPRRPLKAPPWLRWASLAVLVAGGAFALAGGDLVADRGRDGNFLRALAGLVVGIGGAGWLANRLDEAGRRQGARPVDRPPTAD